MGFGGSCALSIAFTAVCTYSRFRFGGVMNESYKVLSRNGCTSLYLLCTNTEYSPEGSDLNATEIHKEAIQYITKHSRTESWIGPYSPVTTQLSS